MATHGKPAARTGASLKGIRTNTPFGLTLVRHRHEVNSAKLVGWSMSDIDSMTMSAPGSE